MTDAGDPAVACAFDAGPILTTLERHGVQYVIVGGYAARMHGATRPTRDVDVTPATTQENLDRLAAALRELDARVRTDAVPEGLPFNASGESLRGQRLLNPQTRHGGSTSPSVRQRSRAVTTIWSGDLPAVSSVGSR